MNKFSELTLSASLQSNLTRHGFVQPTPVQAQAIPPALEGRDVVATAQTGTGKTAKATPYIANGEMVSSFLIINADDLDEAKQIAAKCPAFELGGNVEIRPIQNTAN